MYLQGGRIIEDFKPPRFFDGMLSVSFTGNITTDELEAFRFALLAVAKVGESFPPLVQPLPVNVYFLASGSASFLLDEDALGSFHQCIIFPLQKWRRSQFRVFHMLLPMIEELCHATWQIPDGPLIDAKVNEVLSALGSDMRKKEYEEIILHHMESVQNEQ